MTHLRHTLLLRLICVFSLLLVPECHSVKPFLRPSSSHKLYWIAFQCRPACRNPSQGLSRSVQKRERSHACHLFQKSIMSNPVSKEIRPTRHTLWFFSKAPKTNTILFLLSRSSPQNQPLALVSFCRGKKSSTQGCSYDGKPGFSNSE